MGESHSCKINLFSRHLPHRLRVTYLCITQLTSARKSVRLIVKSDVEQIKSEGPSWAIDFLNNQNADRRQQSPHVN